MEREFTVLILRASTRACAPTSPIMLSERLRTVSVCMNRKYQSSAHEMQKEFTVLIFRASASVCAPTSLILLFSSFSSISVCMNRIE